jgi:hypothetical protein
MISVLILLSLSSDDSQRRSLISGTIIMAVRIQTTMFIMVDRWALSSTLIGGTIEDWINQSPVLPFLPAKLVTAVNSKKHDYFGCLFSLHGVVPICKSRYTYWLSAAKLQHSSALSNPHYHPHYHHMCDQKLWLYNQKISVQRLHNASIDANP